jgi:hypothetical protein
MGTEIEEEEAATNYSILKEYLEAQCRYALKEEDGEMELRPFNDITKVWGYANQVGTLIQCFSA